MFCAHRKRRRAWPERFAVCTVWGALLFAVLQQACPCLTWADAALRKGAVGIIAHDQGHPRAEQVRVRLAAELAAAGFTARAVQASDALRGPDESVPWALVFIVSEGAHVAVDVALPAHGGGAAEARRVIAVGASDALTPTALALRVVEVLRAHLAADVPSSGASAAPSPAASPRETRALRVDGWRKGMHACVMGLWGGQGLEGAIGPRLALALARGRWQVSLSGALAWGASASDRGFQVDVTQALSLVEATWLVRPAGLATPYVSAAAGAMWLEVEARPDPRLQASSSRAGTAVFGAGAGVLFGARRTRVNFIAELRALLAPAPVALEVATGVIARAGAPSVLGFVGAQLWF